MRGLANRSIERCSLAQRFVIQSYLVSFHNPADFLKSLAITAELEWRKTLSAVRIYMWEDLRGFCLLCEDDMYNIGSFVWSLAIFLLSLPFIWATYQQTRKQVLHLCICSVFTFSACTLVVLDTQPSK